MIDISETEGGILLSVRAQPGAKQNAITGHHAGMLKVAVTAQPENGKANVAIVALLARQLGVPKRGCAIRSGLTSRHKRVFVAGVNMDQVLQRLGLD